MESAISGVQLSASSILNKNPNSGVSLLPAVQNFQKERRGLLRVECGAKGAISPSLSEEMIGMKKLMMNESCRAEGDDIVELLECLEKEAIMGDDEGRDPNDYNRRAQIFDKSSEVFQALKNSQNTSSV